MRKTKKQLLGLAGLAAVGIMTAVACAMPSPNAAAAEQSVYQCNDSDSDPNNDCAKGEGGAQVQVTVSEGNPSISTSKPQDGSTVINSNVEIATNYSEVMQIDYYLTYKPTGSEVISRVNLASFTPTETSGIHTFSVDIAQYGYGEYTLHSTAHGYNGATREDTTTFEYSAVRGESSKETSSNGDPVIKVDSNDNVDSIAISVYDKAGNPVFVDEDGNEVPVIVKRDEFDPVTGEVLVTLPFEKYGVPAGEYEAVILALNSEGRTISMDIVTINYNPVVPEVPNSGAGIFADLNITRIDYLLTGLIFFGLVAGFALYLICRKSRR